MTQHNQQSRSTALSLSEHVAAQMHYIQRGYDWTGQLITREEIPMSELKPGQFETVIATYGHMHQGRWMSRQIAENIAEQLARLSQAAPLSPDQMFRIVSARLEDDNPTDPTVGRVIAICEPLVRDNRPYQPKMELK